MRVRDVLIAVAGWFSPFILVGTLYLLYFVVRLTYLAIGGSEGSLDRGCEPESLPASALSVLAPRKYWTEQVAYYRELASRPFNPPSRSFLQRRQDLLQRFHEVVQEVEKEHPELFNRQETPADTLRRQAEALRDRADEIELIAQLRLLDQEAYRDYSESRDAALRCLGRANALLT